MAAPDRATKRPQVQGGSVSFLSDSDIAETYCLLHPPELKPAEIARQRSQEREAKWIKKNQRKPAN